MGGRACVLFCVFGHRTRALVCIIIISSGRVFLYIVFLFLRLHPPILPSDHLSWIGLVAFCAPTSLARGVGRIFGGERRTRGDL